MTDPLDGVQVVTDRRLLPFCLQTHAALDAIRAHYESDGAYGKLPVALAVYVVLTELANRAGGYEARNGFSPSREVIARAAGVSASTADRYLAALRDAGVVSIETQTKLGVGQLANQYVLVEAPTLTPLVAHADPPLVAHADPSLKELQAKESRHLPTVGVFTRSVADCWIANSPPLIAHRPAYLKEDAVKRKIEAAVKRYDEPTVLAAIEAYAQVVASPVHFFSYRWTLVDFLKRGLDRFVPEALPLENFRVQAKTDRRGDPVLTVDDMRRQAVATHLREETIRDDRRGPSVGEPARLGLPEPADHADDVRHLRRGSS